MTIQLAYTAQFEEVSCGDCGITFAIPRHLYRDLVESKRTWHCPNGHPRHFIGKTEAEKLKDELARERQRREMAESEAAMEAKRATKAEKKLKRVQNGVCPCCNRTFQNLGRHMATKHPEHTKE